MAENHESELARAVPLVTERLCRRYPTVPAAVVQRCVRDAVVRGQDARVRRFLPILIERWAAGSLAERATERSAGRRAAAAFDARCA